MISIQDCQHISTTQTNDTFLDGLYDVSAPYYRFLYRLAKLANTTFIVELGVCSGRGTAYLAAATKCRVLAVDVVPMEVQQILAHYPNIDMRVTTSTSEDLLRSVQDWSVDLCFIDTLHNYEQVVSETKAWLPKMSKGGILVYDDIDYNDGMKRFWSELQFTKISLPHLHWTGFGVAFV